MKILVAVTGLILIICVLVGASVPDSETQKNDTVAVIETEAPKGYVVRDWRGKIAVFRAGEGVPESVTGTRTETLPKADVKRVKDGIAADDKKQLDKILEDFCS